MTTTPDHPTPEATPDQLAPVPWGAAERPLRATTILGGAVAYLRANPGLALGAGLVGAMFNAVVKLVVQQGAGPAQQGPATIGTAVATMIVFAAQGGLLLGLLGQAFSGRPVRLREVWAAVARRLPGLVGLTLLVGLALAVLVAVATGLLIVWESGMIRGAALVGAVVVGLVALWLAVRWSLAAPAYLFENTRIREALARSGALVQGEWWRVFGFLLLAFVVGLAFVDLVGLPLGRPPLLNPVVPWESASIGTRLRATIALLIAQTLTVPFLVGLTGLLYVDQRARQSPVHRLRPPTPPGDLPPGIRAHWHRPAMIALVTVLVLGVVAAGVVAYPTLRLQHLAHAYGGGISVTNLDGRPVIVAGSGDGTIRVSDLATGTPIRRLPTGVPELVVHGTAEVEGRTAVLTSTEYPAIVRVWDLATGAPIGQPLIHQGRAERAVAVAAAEVDGRTIVVSRGIEYSGGRTWAWDLATGIPVWEPLENEVAYVHDVATARLDGRPVLISSGRYLDESDPSDIRVRDLATGTPIGQPMERGCCHVSSLTTAELDGRTVLISGGEDGKVRVWDLATGRPIGRPLDHGRAVLAVATTQLDGRTVLISGTVRDKDARRPGGTVQVWDLSTGTRITWPLAHTSVIPDERLEDDRLFPSIRSVAAAQVDGRPVIVAGDSEGLYTEDSTVVDGADTVRVWDPFRWGWRTQ